MITFQMCIKSRKEPSLRNSRVANWNKFAQDVDVAIKARMWNVVHSNPAELDETVETLTKIMADSFKSNCRISKPRKKNCPWWNNNLAELKSACNRAYRTYKISNSFNKETQWTLYKEVRNLYQYEIAIAKRDAWKKFCEEVEGAKATAKIHKALTKSNANMPSILLRPDGSYTKSLMESAKLLLDTHFPGNRCTSEPNPSREVLHSVEIDTITQTVITSDRIKWAID